MCLYGTGCDRRPTHALSIHMDRPAGYEAWPQQLLPVAFPCCLLASAGRYVIVALHLSPRFIIIMRCFWVPLGRRILVLVPDAVRRPILLSPFFHAILRKQHILRAYADYLVFCLITASASSRSLVRMSYAADTSAIGST